MPPNNGAADQSWLESQLRFVTVDLSAPIRVDGRDLLMLRIREPVAKDLRTGKAGADDDELKFQLILASVTGLPLYAIGMLRLPDYKACAEALAELGFQDLATEAMQSAGSPATGSSSSASSPADSTSASASSGG